MKRTEAARESKRKPSLNQIKLKALENKNKELTKQVKITNGEINVLSTKYRKERKKKRVLLVITIFMILFCIACAWLSFYIYKRKTVKVVKYRYTKEVKNKVINKFQPDDEFVEHYHNASYPLKLTSAYGDNDATHPKVLNFKEKWNGYKYWMVYSPYPHSNDSRENPHIRVSNDLINWEVPEGLTNPIDGPPEDYKNMVIYYSDPHLVYNDDKDELECYYRRVDDKKDEMVLYRKTTKDGIHWSDREVITTTKRSEHDYVSPAIIYDEGIYKMWYVDKNNTNCYAESKDGYHYSDCKKINLKYPLTVKTWHLDVIKTEKGYEMITVAFNNWNDRAVMNLYYFHSDTETGFKNGTIIIKPSHVSWDNGGLYRSTFIYENGIYYVFYSGISSNFDRGVGLSYGKHIENLIGSNIKQQKDVLEEDGE